MPAINWYPGHMAKTRRMLVDNLKMIDVVVEVIDARAPLASRNPDFDDLFVGKARVVLGWSRDPHAPDWRGGEASGVIAPGPRLVSDPPLAGLAANARPDPADIPNNHWSYAVQWFLFAGTALVIYALALWKRARP